jgi:hypothetical protein
MPIILDDRLDSCYEKAFQLPIVLYYVYFPAQRINNLRGGGFLASRTPKKAHTRMKSVRAIVLRENRSFAHPPDQPKHRHPDSERYSPWEPSDRKCTQRVIRVAGSVS